jgi:signal transduction histidine kinase
MPRKAGADESRMKLCDNCAIFQGIIEDLRMELDKKAREEEVLRQQFDVTAEIFQSVPFGLLVYQFQPPGELFCLTGNPVAGRLTGLEAGSLLGMEFEEMWPSARSQGITAAFLNTARTGEPFEAPQAHFRRGRIEKALKIRAFAITGNRIVAVLEEIPDQKQTAETIHRVRELEMQLEEMSAHLAGKDQLLQDEIVRRKKVEQPRSATAQYSTNQDLLNLTDRYTSRFLESIKRQAQRALLRIESGYFTLVRSSMENIIRKVEQTAEILELLRQSTKSQLASTTPGVEIFDLNEAAAQAVELSGTLFEPGGELALCPIELSVTPDCCVRADRRRITGAITHLLNSISAGLRGKGRIVMKTVIADRNVVLSIMGSPENAPDEAANSWESIFDSKTSHSGLGLALVSTIMRNHAGALEMDSRNGALSIRVRLPYVGFP